MKQVCLTSNVVLVFNRNVYDDFDTSDIEEKIKNIYTSQTPEIGSTNFPNEMKAVFSPTEQIQVIAQKNSVAIGDTKINEANTVNNTDLLRLALKVYEEMIAKSLSLKQYGYNFIFTLQEEEFQSIQDKIKAKYFKQNIYTPRNDVLFAVPTYAYKKDGVHYTYKYDVAHDEDSNPSKVNIAVNAHYESATIPSDAESLIAQFTNEYQYVYAQIVESL